MTLEAADAARHRVLADERRVRIVAELDAEPGGLDASELGRRLGLHANTIRWHLGILGDAGLVSSKPETRSTPGRPRILYRPGTRLRSAENDEYRLLASVLADTLSREDRGVDACEQAGRAWGADLVGGRERCSGTEVEQVVGLLAAQGFEPEADQLAITMHRCPFHDLAEVAPEIVCTVHRGLISGALEELGSPLTVAALDVFPRPNVCVARLAPRPLGA